MKKLVYYLLITLGIVSCNKDDFSEEIYMNDAISDEKSEIVLKFSLKDENGRETTTFKKNENIIFDLAIENMSNKDFIYKQNFEGDSDLSFGSDFFYVYTDKGKGLGAPWSSMFCEYSLQKEFKIPAKTTYHISCPWQWTSSVKATHPLCKDEDGVTPTAKSLSKGKYISTFSVKYRAYPDDENLTEKKFTIYFSVK